MPELDFNGYFGPIIHTKKLTTPGERSEFFVRARKGKYVALFRGVHVEARWWQAMDRHEQYRTRVRAAVESIPGPTIVSHESAAAMWRLPFVGQWPTKVHVCAAHADGGRTNAMFVRHTVGIPDETVYVAELQATHLARTVVDLARRLPFPHAVVVADAALRRTLHPVRGIPTTSISVDDLRRELAMVPLTHGSAKASRVIEFANGLADRPGESMSRASMHIAGITPPELQVDLLGRSGRRYVVDFWWRQIGKAGEFDGKEKYRDPDFLRGRTPEQALLDEKAREDDLRAAGYGMSRWGWQMAVSASRLRVHLHAAGIH